MLHALLTIMNKVGSAVFDNLPLIFAVGVAIGMAKKEKEVAALSDMLPSSKQVFIISLVYLEGSISDLEIVKATAPTLSTV